MAVGLPVVASRLGGIPEAVEDNVNGFLATPGNPEELAAAIEKLINDNKVRAKMGQVGRKIYEKNSQIRK